MLCLPVLIHLWSFCQQIPGKTPFCSTFSFNCFHCNCTMLAFGVRQTIVWLYVAFPTKASGNSLPLPKLSFIKRCWFTKMFSLDITLAQRTPNISKTRFLLNSVWIHSRLLGSSPCHLQSRDPEGPPSAGILTTSEHWVIKTRCKKSWGRLQKSTAVGQTQHPQLEWCDPMEDCCVGEWQKALGSLAVVRLDAQCPGKGNQ